MREKLNVAESHQEREGTYYMGFVSGSVVKNLPTNAEDAGSIPRSRRAPGEENGNPLQYSCLGNHMDRGAWQAAIP